MAEALRIAVFFSHPIQYFAPLWRELSAVPGVELQVFYYSRQGVEHSADTGFGLSFAWDVDLLGGYRSEFLPRQWPTDDPLDPTPKALNAGMYAVLRRGWDAVIISGYAHANNWFITLACSRLRIPVLCWADTNPRTERAKSRLKLTAKRALLSVFFARITGFLASGGGTRQYFAQYGAAPEAIFLAPFAVDVPRFKRTVAEASETSVQALRERLGIAAGRKIVMFCGKLSAHKRPLDVLAAVQRLQRDDTFTVFVGDGEQRQELERRAGGMAVVTGFVNQAELPLVLSLAHVLVLSSEYEPYGMIVAEAHAVGVPAIVSDACGCYGPESVLRDGESGFVYVAGDVNMLAEHLQRLLSDDALHTRMAASARIQGESQSPAVAAQHLLAAVHYAVRAQRSRR